MFGEGLVEVRGHLEQPGIPSQDARPAPLYRHEARDGLPAAGDDHFLALGHSAQEVGERRLCLMHPDFDHGPILANSVAKMARSLIEVAPIGIAGPTRLVSLVMSRDKVRVAVVFGGRSSEHAISCISAGSVLSRLDQERYEIVPVGITRSGAWVLGTDDPRELVIAGRELPSVDESRTALALPGDPTRGGLVVLDPDRAGEVFSGVDVVFPVLHGPFGEDGTIQGLLEMAGVPYVGAGVLATAAGMDKEFAKKLLAADGLPVGDLVVLRPGTAPSQPSSATGWGCRCS